MSGLTCTDENALTKSNFVDHATKHRIAIVFPDTSARNTGIEGITQNWDFGEGAGFYVDATNPKYSKHFNMYSYILKELPQTVNNHFNVDPKRKSITGHSMGGRNHNNIYTNFKFI